MSDESRKTKKEYFYIPKDLDENEQESNTKVQGSLEKNSTTLKWIEASGCTLVTPEKLKEMIEDGYHILTSEPCGPLISIRYEKRNQTRKRGR